MPELSVLLVNHNGGELLRKCLASFTEEAKNRGWEIVMVDNASTDGSPEIVRAEFPSVRLVRNRENAGFSRANNRALRESGGEHVLFLNPDTLLYPGSMKKLLDAVRQDKNIGGAGPALLTGEKVFQASFGRSMSFFSELFKKCILNRWRRRTLKRSRKTRKTGWVSGACLLARRKAVEDAGGFDENYFLYFEDIDLCFKMRQAGWKVVFVPTARVFHAGGASAGRNWAASRVEYRRSQLYFYRKHNSRLSLRLLRCYLRLVLAVLSLSKRSKSGEYAAYRDVLRGLLKAQGAGAAKK